MGKRSLGWLIPLQPQLSFAPGAFIHHQPTKGYKSLFGLIAFALYPGLVALDLLVP